MVARVGLPSFMFDSVTREALLFLYVETADQ